MLILITGILPTVAQEAKRERETEMLFRGRQIVSAIARYQIIAARRANQPSQPGVPGAVAFALWPSSLDVLVNGINVRGLTSKVHLLRPSAVKDPLNKNAPWKPVGFGDPALREFLEAYFEYIGRTMPPQIRIKYLGTTIDLGNENEKNQAHTSSQGTLGGSGASTGFSQTFSDSGTTSGFGQAFSPGQGNQRVNFLFGVVSASKDRPIRDYYGLERYNQWVFAYIPDLQAMPPTGDQQIQMLSREIIFPSDSLSLNQLGGGFGIAGFNPSVGSVGSGAGSGVGGGSANSGQKPTGGSGGQAGTSQQSPQQSPRR
jgi:hypothetical protein